MTFLLERVVNRVKVMGESEISCNEISLLLSTIV